MNQNHKDLTIAFDGSDCMGTFTKEDRQCAAYCVLRLRCAIEKEQNLRLEMIEDLIAADNELNGKIQ